MNHWAQKLGEDMRSRFLAGAGVLALAAGGVLLSAPASSASGPPPCTVTKESPGWGHSQCFGGSGQQRVVLTCGSGSSQNVNYGSWVPANGTQSHAYCRIPTTITLVDVEYVS